MCQNNTVSLPGSCITAGAGGVFFDLSHLNTTSRTSHVFEGNVTVSVLQSFTGGTFNVTVCNDRDDDALCANNDVVDEDIGSDHGTSPRHDDQFAQAEHSKNRQSPTVLPFCFADDAFTHDIDDIVIFVGTVATQPSIGTASVHLSTITMVGDDTSGCTSVNYQNTHGTRDWL